MSRPLEPPARALLRAAFLGAAHFGSVSACLAASVAEPEAARCAEVTAADAVPDELARLLAESRVGRVPPAEVVDEVLLESSPGEPLRFAGALRRAASRPDVDAGTAALHAVVCGFPRRTALALEAGDLPLEAVVTRVDAGLEVALSEGSPAVIGVSVQLAQHRLDAAEGAREARRRLQPVLEAALARDENEARGALRDAFVSAAEGLQPAFVDAVRAVATPKRLEILVGLLRQRPGADGLVLNRVHGLALKLGPVLHDLELEVLRRFLESDVAFERIGAAQSLGALEDRGALTGLVALLRDTDPSVRNAAHDALRHVSAMTIGPSPERWQGWLTREETWWRERGAAELGRLRGVDRAEALAILRDAAQHRLYRDEVANAAAPLLHGDDPTLVRIALATLESVRARGVELDVVELLEHPSSTVRAQAGAFLRAVTGRVLPPDPMAWRQVLRP